MITVRNNAWRRKIVLAFRVITLVIGLYQLFFGEQLTGFYIMAALMAITLPGLVTRNFISSIPLEFELIFFIMVMLQLILGETFNFYDNVPYYDKLVHFTVPLFMGYIAALLAYTLRLTGNLAMTVMPTMFIIVFLTLGIGAAWEIVEYVGDHVLGLYLQGSITASPLVDTMNDLIVDTLGGMFGAILALRFIRSHRRREDFNLGGLTDEILLGLSKKTRAQPSEL